MKIEQQRGISVTSLGDDLRARRASPSTCSTRRGTRISREDTYRTLTAVDSAVMVIDAAKGIEPQTRKLFEVCRLRYVPIITFVNKVDREGRAPFELLDEVADMLALDVCPMSWPVGMGGEFEGVLDLFANTLSAGPRATAASSWASERLTARRSDAGRRCPPRARQLREEAELAQGGYPDVRCRGLSQRRPDAGLFRLGAQGFRRRRADRRARRLRAAAAPAAGRRRRRSRPTAHEVTGFVFKVQANMDPQHRDRIAFMRLCLGHVQARHEADAVGHRQADRGALADPVLRAGPRDRRRGRSPATSSASPTTARCGSATR